MIDSSVAHDVLRVCGNIDALNVLTSHAFKFSHVNLFKVILLGYGFTEDVTLHVRVFFFVALLDFLTLLLLLIVVIFLGESTALDDLQDSHVLEVDDGDLAATPCPHGKITLLMHEELEATPLQQLVVAVLHGKAPLELCQLFGAGLPLRRR